MSTLPPLSIDFSDDDFPKLPLNLAQSAVMPVVVHPPDGGLIGLGTAFNIAPGLMLTAWHVMDAAIRRHDALAEGATTGVVYVASGSEHAIPGFFGGLLPVMNSRYNEMLDVALLEVGVPLIEGQPVSLRSLPLTAELPTVGDEVLALGYPRIEGHHLQHGEVENAYELQADFHATHGTVEEVHPVMLDSSFLRFPCFRTNARFDAGMSGGPVFNAEGFVCGIVCVSFNFSPDPGSSFIPDQNGYTSYASSLYPAFALEATLGEGDEKRMYSILELARQGAIQGHESLSRLEITIDASGYQQITLRA